MCQKQNCYHIEIIEIHNNIKIVVHYDKELNPIFIQYWDESRSDLDFELVNE